jgi:hypothetical protein
MYEGAEFLHRTLGDQRIEHEYLDYYASRRVTNDRHVRIYADGRCENLPAIRELRLCSKDPKEDARLEAEYFTENQKVAKMLEEKGFGLGGESFTNSHHSGASNPSCCRIGASRIGILPRLSLRS